MYYETIQIDFNSDEAIYIQLRNQIILGIATSRIQEGDTLPSVRQLAYQPSRQWCAGAVRERPGRNRKVPEHQRGGVPELTYISSIPERTA